MRDKVQKRGSIYRFVTLVLLTLLVSTSLAFPAVVGRFDDAVAAYERGDYATAFRLMKPFAEKGDAKSQHNLGVMYDYGRGVPQNVITSYSIHYTKLYEPWVRPRRP